MLTKIIDKKQIETENQIVDGTPILSQIGGDMKKFRTEPNLEMHRVAPNAKANSLPLK